MLLIGLSAGCGSAQLGDYKKTVKSGIDTLPWPKEMEKLLGEGDHFITHYGFSPGPKTWNSEIYFGGRYVFTLQVDVDVDYKKRAINKAVTSPQFYLKEVDRVQINPSGSPVTFYSEDWVFDEDKWKKLLKSGGDWSQIGIAIKTNPVAGFDSYATAMHAPRVRVPH